MLSIGKLWTGQEMYYLERVAETRGAKNAGEGEIVGLTVVARAADVLPAALRESMLRLATGFLLAFPQRLG